MIESGVHVTTEVSLFFKLDLYGPNLLSNNEIPDKRGVIGATSSAHPFAIGSNGVLVGATHRVRHHKNGILNSFVNWLSDWCR